MHTIVPLRRALACLPRALSPAHLLTALALLLLPVGTAHAQLTKIFVSATGNDASDGARGTPKRTFQSAHDAVAANGQIVVLDTAGYGALNITKSLTVTVPAGVTGFVTAPSGSNGVTVDAGTSGIVALSGLTIEGATTGIQITSVGRMHVSDCLLRACTNGIQDNSTGAIYIRDSAFHDNNDGLFIQCLTGLAPVSVERCRFEGNYFGIRGVDNARVSVRDSVAHGSAPPPAIRAPTLGSSSSAGPGATARCSATTAPPRTTATVSPPGLSPPAAAAS